MKIQIITNLFPVPWHHMQAVFNYQQFTHLARKCEIRILVLIPWLEFISHWRERKNPVPALNAPVTYAMFFYIPKLFRFLYPILQLPTLLTSYKRIKNGNPDCLLLSWAYPDAVSGIMLSKLTGIPAVIKVHGSDINTHASYPSRARQIVWAMKNAKAVISVSEDLANTISAMGVPRDTIKVIYNGVDQKKFSPKDQHLARQHLGLNQDRRILLFIGNLKREKGCLDLFEAFRRFARQDDAVDLYYIGKGETAAELSARIAHDNLSDRVHIVGTVNHEVLPEWINASDSVVLPSHNEGVPNVLLEAMACGVPVLATKVGGIPEIVSDYNGLLVELGDNEKLAEGLEAVLKKNWDREEIVKTVKRFTWENNVQELQKVLHSVC